MLDNLQFIAAIGELDRSK